MLTFWKFSYIAQNDAVEHNTVQGSLDSDPQDPYCAEAIHPPLPIDKQSPIEAYLEANLERTQAFKMMIFAKKVNSIKILTIFWQKVLS